MAARAHVLTGPELAIHACARSAPLNEDDQDGNGYIFPTRRGCSTGFVDTQIPCACWFDQSHPSRPDHFNLLPPGHGAQRPRFPFAARRPLDRTELVPLSRRVPSLTPWFGATQSPSAERNPGTWSGSAAWAQARPWLDPTSSWMPSHRRPGWPPVDSHYR